MNETPFGNIEANFFEIRDPRVEGRCDHKLIEIIIIAICAMIAGAESWTEIETFAKSKQAWLGQFLELGNGIPSHDTFGRVFAALDGNEFERCFIRWVARVFKITKGQVVSLDGKTVRRSHDKTLGKDAIHMVSAWARHNGITLGQCKVDDKSNEITAIPPLLRLLDVAGCLVTIDAMGCQKEIAKTIREEKAHYVLRVKDNHSNLHQDIQDWFAHADQVSFQGMTHDYHKTVNKGHGRIEIRQCWTIADPVAFEYIRHYEGWVDLQTIIRVHRERRIGEKVETETGYYISSYPNDAQHLLKAVRHHWSIENSLHWVLDVTFGEDQSRVRSGDAPENMSVLRRIALNILKKDTSKGSLRQKRYRAALDDTFLHNLLDSF